LSHEVVESGAVPKPAASGVTKLRESVLPAVTH
jgi:hypothetical protein